VNASGRGSGRNAACAGGRQAGRAVGLYRRRPAATVLYQLVQERLETFLALSEEGTGEGLPGYVERDFRKYLDCGILARGFARARCKDCGEDYLIAFSCKTRGACPSCNTRRMVEIIALITEAPTVRAILNHIGEPSAAAPISPCRGPPQWEMFDQTVEIDPIHPEPEYDFDQRVSS
jgi:hypothetical protein